MLFADCRNRGGLKGKCPAPHALIGTYLAAEIACKIIVGQRALVALFDRRVRALAQHQAALAFCHGIDTAASRL